MDVFYDLDVGERVLIRTFLDRSGAQLHVCVRAWERGFFGILEIEISHRSECLTNTVLDYNFFTHESACWVIRTYTKAVWFVLEE